MELKWNGLHKLEELKRLQNIPGIKDGGIYLQFIEHAGFKRIIYVGTAFNIYKRQNDYYLAYNKAANKAKTALKRNQFATYILKNMTTNNIENDIYKYFLPIYYDNKIEGKYLIVGGDNYYFKRICCDDNMSEDKYDEYRMDLLSKIKFSFANISITEPEKPLNMGYKNFLQAIEERIIRHLLKKIRDEFKISCDDNKKENEYEYGVYDSNERHTCFGKIEGDYNLEIDLINNYDLVSNVKEWFEYLNERIELPVKPIS